MTQPVASFRMTPRPWAPAPEQTGRDGQERFVCDCCGLPTAGRPQVWKGRFSPGARICPVCDLLQSMARPGIEREATLIWWPETSQQSVLSLVRTAHAALLEGLGSHAEAQSWHRCMDALTAGEALPLLQGGCRAPAAVMVALLSRQREASRRLQTTSPRQLATALMLVNADREEVSDSLEDLHRGLRLLPLGRLYDGPNDIYRDFLVASRAATS